MNSAEIHGAVPLVPRSPVADGTDDRREARIIARARETITRLDAMPPVEIEARPAREVMPDLATLQRRWKTGVHLSEDEFNEMRSLETLARHAPTPSPAKPQTVNRAPARKSSNTDMAVIDRERMAELETRLKSFGRWSDAERVEWWNINARAIMDDVDTLVGKRNVTDAIFRVVREFAIVAIQQTQGRERLEDRVAALEPKPRIRVKAIHQVIA